ncbi:trichohyalin isoform X1 [Polypterus senegalus]|uniref:trichohyalin isoform X1 n=1 Tax=Polypterus senegalus TaxID=55291 RepID=UPI001965F886|nr:trichohyalin isoform X1 [Polypterus senegalus]
MIVKHVAGVPLLHFDDVTIDSDLDSVRTEKVQKQFQKALTTRNGAVNCSGSLTSQWAQSPMRETSRYDCSEKTMTDDEGDDMSVKNSCTLRIHSPTRWSKSQMQTNQLCQNEDLQNVTQAKQDLTVMEDSLLQKKYELRDADKALSSVLQLRKYAVQELDSVKTAIERSKKEARILESQLRESKSQVEETRTELVFLEYRRDTYLKEVQALEEELKLLRRKCSAAQKSQMGTHQYEATAFSPEWKESKFCGRQNEVKQTMLEMQELERQLNNAKSDLFAEQRRSREKIDLLQEQLEECQIQLEERVAEVSALQEENCRMQTKQQQEKQTQKTTEHISALESKNEHSLSSQDQDKQFQFQLDERDSKIAGLEKILSEKELKMLKLRENLSAMQTDQETLKAATEKIKQDYEKQLQQLQHDKDNEKEQDIEHIKTELNLLKQHEMQKLRENSEQERFAALKEQSAYFTQEVGSLTQKVQLKEEEILKLMEMIRKHEESMKNLTEDLKKQSRQLVQDAVQSEKKKWEEEKAKELKHQYDLWEKERKRTLTDMQEDQERERRNALSLQNKIIELQNRVQELESECRTLQREKQDAVMEVRSLMKEDKQQEVNRIKTEMEQEKAQEADRFKLKIQQLQDDLQMLRARLSETTRLEKEKEVQAERQERNLAMELQTECERIKDLALSSRGCAPTGSSHFRQSTPSVLTVPQALQALRGACEELYQNIMDIHQELERRGMAIQHVHRDKDREMKQQRERLLLEKEEALMALKERLIQEHIDEISMLQRTQLGDSGNSEKQSLRQQLREKNNELRAIQRNMTKWKDETATKLACKFEEQLNGELEKRLSHSTLEHQQKIEKLESEMRWLTKKQNKNTNLRSASSPSLTTTSSTGHQEFGTLKLLQHLKNRVKQLRAENTLYHGSSLDNLASVHEDFSGTYREMMQAPAERMSSRFRSGKGKSHF